jgi:hypothetical protein
VASLTAGAVLAVWIVAEALLLRTVLPVQLAYLLLGFGLVARSFREARAALPPPRAARAT